MFCARVAKSNGCTSWNYKFQRVKQRERMRDSLLFLFVSVSSIKIHEILFVFFFVIIVPRLRLYVYLIKSFLTIIASLLISYHAFCWCKYRNRLTKTEIFHLEISRITLIQGYLFSLVVSGTISHFNFIATQRLRYKNLKISFCVSIIYAFGFFWHDSCIFYSGSQNLSKFYLIYCYHVL